MTKRHLGLVAAFSLLTVTTSHAIVVFDPSNFGQNIATAARTLQSNLNEARQIANQIQSLTNQARNLAQLPISHRVQLIGAIGRLESVIASARGIAFDYRTLQTTFDRFYPDASVYASESGAAIAVRSAEWSDQTRRAVNDALLAQGLVTDIETDRVSLGALMTASSSAEGALQAAQAANEIAGLTVTQLMRLEHIVAGSLRAQTAYLAAQASSEQAATTQLDRLGNDWGTGSTRSTPSEANYLNPLR